MRKRSKFAYAAILILTDIVAYYVALVVAYELRLLSETLFGIRELQFSFTHFAAIWWILATILLFQLANGLYYRRDPLWIESGKLLRSLTSAFIIILAIVSLAQMSGNVSRLFLSILWVLTIATIAISRVVVKRNLFKLQYFKENLLLVGDASRLEEVAKAFSREWFMGINIAKQLPIEPIPSSKEIDNIIDTMEIHGAVVVPPDSDSEGAIELFSYIHTRVMRMIYVPKASAMDLTNAETGQLLRSQLGYMSVNNALASPLNKLLKRIFDLLLFILITPIVLPIILILMLVVKLTSPGAAIFSHERIGRDGKTFKVYKLRSMYKDSKERLAEMLANDPAVKAEWEAFYKLKDDPRITPLGKFLRKSSLDELPQFFNVFLGNMSFVGPRPVLKDELDRYYKEKTVYYNMATPGITGLWQVSGRNDTTYDDRISMDCWYVFNWSLWLDIVILFSTPLVVIFRRGAY